MKVSKVIVWDFKVITAVICLSFFFYFAFINPIIYGINSFEINYWIDIFKKLNIVKSVQLVFGILFTHFYPIFEIYTNFSRTTMCIFTDHSIYVYALSGVNEFPWDNVKSIKVKHIGNLKGRKSNFFKFFEVTLHLKEEQQIKFQFETFSDTKVPQILELWESSQIK
jgi:hypothetical protein